MAEIGHKSGRLSIRELREILNESKEPLESKYELRIRAEKKTQVTLQRMQKDFVDSINAYSLVLVLLATVTFAGFLQPPGGVDSNTGLLQPSAAIKIFIYFNSFSFYLSVADLLLCVCSSLSPLTSTSSSKEDFPVVVVGGHGDLQSEQSTTKHLAQFVASTLFKLIFVNVLFAVSLVCCVAAYAAAGFVVTNSSPMHGRTRVPVVVTAVTGLVFFSFFMVWLLRDTFRFVSKALSDKSLSTSLQNRAGSLQVQFRYLKAYGEL